MNQKRKFYTAFNAIAITPLSLTSAKCIPYLLYTSEDPLFNSAQFFSKHILFILFKIFKTASADIIIQCQEYFPFL